MGKVVEKKRKKKKGRPSLLDIQKRNLKQQQEEELRKQQSQEQQLRRSNKVQNPNPNNIPTPVRRSTRRHPNPDISSPAFDDETEIGAEDDEGDQSTGKRRREKKLKLVSKLPDSSVNSGSFNSGSDSNPEDEDTATASHKKRRIEAIGDRSGQRKDDKVGDKQGGSTNPTITKQDIKLDDGPSTPLPDKKLLLFILDRLQKKDTYGVFAEPVDPEELPDYHEVIEQPMDFSTIRKKLVNGAYVHLEQFEKDVFLLCSNAMQYNAPDTIYFRQARSIQELAKKNFENLRQDSDDNDGEPKIARRGRPPTKNLKKSVGKPSLERTISDGPEATLATGVENSTRTNYDIRKASSLDKYGSPDTFGRINYGSRQGEVYISWSMEKYDRADELIGSTSKGISMKHGKKQIVLDENRRNTYKLSCTSASGRDPSSALTVFHGERKQLVPVGLHTEYGYARSLARFAAKLGPVAWKVASKRIERCFPSGVKFGPGWVGEKEAGLLNSINRSSSNAAAPFGLPECNGNKLSEDQEGNTSLEKQVPSSQSVHDDNPGKTTSLSISRSATAVSSPPVTKSSPGPSSVSGEAVLACNLRPSSNTLNSSGVGATRPRTSSQAHQQSLLALCVNGINGTYGPSLQSQSGKLIRVARPTSAGAQSHSGISPPNGNILPPPTENNGSGEMKKSENSSTDKHVDCLPNSRTQQKPAQSGSQPAPDHKAGSAPPDLNIGFQLPGSPSARPEAVQPDLALQL